MSENSGQLYCTVNIPDNKIVSPFSFIAITIRERTTLGQQFGYKFNIYEYEI